MVKQGALFQEDDAVRFGVKISVFALLRPGSFGGVQNPPALPS